MLTKLFQEFFDSEKSSGIILIFCLILSLLMTNLFMGAGWIDFWHMKINWLPENLGLNMSIEHCINDGLMVVFFLLVGLEIERELYDGELSDFKNALLPVIGAIGGMLVPFLIYFIINSGSEYLSGSAIPMATDIAFAIAVLSILGSRVPGSLKVYLTALAIIDDLGAIIIIAIFYTKNLYLTYLLISLGIFGLLLILNRLKVRSLLFYIIPGIAMWYFMLLSGVHATITGVLLAFAIPFFDGKENSPSYKLQHFLHKPVAYLILPVFALANTGILLTADFYDSYLSTAGIGIIAGLVLGKPIGIFLFSWISVKLKIVTLPSEINFKMIFGAGILAGIGFTMSIFIALLSFENQMLIDHAKIAVLSASIIAGIIGFTYLNSILKENIMDKG